MASLILIKTTPSRIIVLTLTFYVHSVRAQTSDLQQVIHKEVVRCYPVGERWENDKKMLLSHSKEELTKALLAEVDVDARSGGEVYDRSVGIRRLYKALNLSPASICQALDEAESTSSKVVLIRALEEMNTSEVTTCLLRQLNDRRPALSHVSIDGEGVAMHAMRVCDIAANAISHNLEPNLHGFRVYEQSSDQRRDEDIRKMLNDLHLKAPQ